MACIEATQTRPGSASAWLPCLVWATQTLVSSTSCWWLLGAVTAASLHLKFSQIVQGAWSVLHTLVTGAWDAEAPPDHR